LARGSAQRARRLVDAHDAPGLLAVRRLSAEHAGRDIVAVAHGGTIRAALALALGLEPERALALSVDNCSLTRLERIAGPVSSRPPREDGDEAWRVVRVNQPPR
jgi:broad specificity phosphatase PhoE